MYHLPFKRDKQQREGERKYQFLTVIFFQNIKLKMISIVLFEGTHELIKNSFEALTTYPHTHVHIYLKAPFIFCDFWMKNQMKTFPHILLTEYHTITNQSRIYMCIYTIYIHIFICICLNTYEKCHILLIFLHVWDLLNEKHNKQSKY